MKNLRLIIILFASSVLMQVFAEDIPLTLSNTDPNPIRPRTPVMIPVTVDLSETGLYLNFSSAVGLATITVKDSNADIVYQETLDTNTYTELLIDTANWEADAYTIEITYSTFLLWGEFDIE